MKRKVLIFPEKLYKIQCKKQNKTFSIKNQKRVDGWKSKVKYNNNITVNIKVQ